MRDIKVAYHKLAKQYHPDKVEKDDDKPAAEAMFKKAQRSKKVAGKKQGTAVQGDDGKMRDPTARELGTPKQFNEEELHEQVKEIIRSILLTKEE